MLYAFVSTKTIFNRISHSLIMYTIHYIHVARKVKDQFTAMPYRLTHDLITTQHSLMIFLNNQQYHQEININHHNLSAYCNSY